MINRKFNFFASAKLALCSVLIVLMTVQNVQAAPIASVESTIAALVMNKAAARTYVAPPGQLAMSQAQMAAMASETRFMATLDGMGAALTTVAVGAGAAVVVGTSIAWVPLLASAGIAGLVSGAVSLAVGGLTSWLFNSDKTVTLPGPSVPAGGFPPFNQQGKTSWADGDRVYPGMDSRTCALTLAPGPDGYDILGHAFIGAIGSVTVGSSMNIWCVHPTASNPGAMDIVSLSFSAAFFNGQALASSTSNYGGSGGVVSGVQTPSAAVLAIPASDRALPASPALLAAAANTSWKAATDAGLAPIPYDASNPITPGEVTAVQAQRQSVLGESPVTLGSVAGPSVVSGAPVKFPVPNVGTAATAPLITGTQTTTTTTTSTGSTAVTNINIDLGPDPGIDFAVPASQSMLNPFFDLLPGFKNYHAPTRLVACPVYHLSLWNHDFVMDTQCTLIEAARSKLQALASVVWAIAGVVIVLGA